MVPPRAWSTPLQRAFTSFPSGWIGAALLLLRGVVGTSAMIEATLLFTHPDSLLALAAACLAALAGLALMLGFLTPVASALLAAQGATIFLFTPGVVLHWLDSRMALFEFAIMATALAILGPGAASIDARLFGRREVTISEQHRPNDL